MSSQILLVLSKISLSAGMVIGITLVAEIVSTRLAGVLLGFPLGAGLTFFFTGVELGPLFAAESAPWAIQGLSGTLVFCAVYQLCSMRLFGDKMLSMLIPAFLGLCGYFIMACCLQYFLAEMPLMRVSLVSVAFLATAIFFRKSPSPAIKHRVLATKRIVIVRACFAALIILSITGAASILGPKWVGIFAAFPTTVLPSILLLHYHYGSNTISAVFREMPFGMIAIVVFSVAVFFSFPVLGVYLGTFVSYLIAFFYILFYEAVLRPLFDNVFEKYFNLH